MLGVMGHSFQPLQSTFKNAPGRAGHGWLLQSGWSRGRGNEENFGHHRQTDLKHDCIAQLAFLGCIPRKSRSPRIQPRSRRCWQWCWRAQARPHRVGKEAQSRDAQGEDRFHDFQRLMSLNVSGALRMILGVLTSKVCELFRCVYATATLCRLLRLQDCFGRCLVVHGRQGGLSGSADRNGAVQGP